MSKSEKLTFAVSAPKTSFEDLVHELDLETEEQQKQNWSDSSAEVEKKWFIVQTISGYEAKAKDLLEALIRDYKVENAFGEILLPLERVITYSRSREKRSERKLFPGYLFVEMVMDTFTFDFVRRSTHIIGFLGQQHGKQPEPVSEEEIAKIKALVYETEINPRKNLKVVVGDSVRVKKEPFEGQVGEVSEVNEELLKVTVILNIFNRSSSVELSFMDIELVNN